ncbi:MAG TPA: right-handed parallel beta-helix repeat-containing protein, partial [Alphaproteobacteria bacterium]|nr:right-handed parallel beta-helix repeat-containing protein [Alphaproteobacteria bacterium]
MVYATPASAQATRTWVSGVGDDVNPCSRTAPCKTFAG